MATTVQTETASDKVVKAIVVFHLLLPFLVIAFCGLIVGSDPKTHQTYHRVNFFARNGWFYQCAMAGVLSACVVQVLRFAGILFRQKAARQEPKYK